MAVYVDDIVVWSHAKGKYKAGSCHLCADTLAELHEFAARCGFKRSWYHQHRKMPHYDLVSADRDTAIRLGAEPVSSREIVLRSRAARAKPVPTTD